MDETLALWGRNLTEAVAAAGLTQAEFAARVGVGHSTVSRWLGGRMEPHRRHKPVIASVLDRDVTDLFPLPEEVA